MRIHVETWTSDANKEEQHLFVEDERNTYIIGFNPKFFTLETILDFLRSKDIIK